MKPAGTRSARLRRAALLIAAAFALSTPRTALPPPPLGGPGMSNLRVTPVLLDAADPSRRQVGALTFRRGWALDGEDRRFGGISALQVEGGRVTALSDTGVIFEFALPVAAGRQPLRLTPLPHRAGDRKSAHDTEAMLFGPGKAWIAFERNNRVARFDRASWTAEAVARPRAMRRWRGNSGPEAMVRLGDGRFLLMAEGGSEGPYSAAILFDGDPADADTPSVTLRYRRPAGFRVTDAALLPSGRLLVLHRRFTLFGGPSAKLSIVELGQPGEGEILSGTEIAELRSPLTVDNMEAVSVSVEQGRTIVRLASDDNFMAIQRSLLLEFELAPEE